MNCAWTEQLIYPKKMLAHCKAHKDFFVEVDKKRDNKKKLAL